LHGATQWPETQLAPGSHARPHAPQFAESVARSTHALLQLTAVAGQVAAHALAVQTGVGAAQAFPHEPQFAGSEVTSVHAVPQAILGAAHALTHFPDMQLEPAPQALPQLPQLDGSVARSTHAPPQLVLVPGQVATHAPAEQLGVMPLQALPQLPQFLVSLESVTHAPEQVACPVAHAPASVPDLVVLSLPQPPASSRAATRASRGLNVNLPIRPS
jgi:hypothetical protein